MIRGVVNGRREAVVPLRGRSPDRAGRIRQASSPLVQIPLRPAFSPIAPCQQRSYSKPRPALALLGLEFLPGWLAGVRAAGLPASCPLPVARCRGRSQVRRKARNGKSLRRAMVFANRPEGGEVARGCSNQAWGLTVTP
jgi:hypothetical protein